MSNLQANRMPVTHAESRRPRGRDGWRTPRWATPAGLAIVMLLISPTFAAMPEAMAEETAAKPMPIPAPAGEAREAGEARPSPVASEPEAGADPTPAPAPHADAPTGKADADAPKGKADADAPKGEADAEAKDATPEVHIVGCYEAYVLVDGGKHPEGRAEVRLDRPGPPVVLVLTAYEPAHWNLLVSDRTNLKRVIVSGYYAQKLEWLRDKPEDTVVERHVHETREGHSRVLVWENDKRFDSARTLLRKLLDLKPDEPVKFSLQGSYKMPYTGYAVTAETPTRRSRRWAGRSTWSASA